jgi:hypothetical protein
MHFDEGAPWFNMIAHQCCKYLIGTNRVFNLNP